MPSALSRTGGRVLGEALALGALLLFSANVFVVGAAERRVPQRLGFAFGLGSNVILALLLLMAQLGIDQRSVGSFEWDALALFVLGGLLTSYLGRWFFFRSVRTVGATRSSAIQITNPAFAALIGWIFLDEALASPAIGSGLLVLTGLLLTTRPSGRARDDFSRIPRSVPIAELLLALVGAMAYGAGNVVRGAGVRDWAAPVVGSLAGATAGLIVHACVTGRFGTIRALRAADRTGRWLWIASGALTIGAQTLLIAATLYIPVAVAVVIAAALPIVVLPMSALLLRRTEVLGARTIAGVLLTSAGVAGLVLLNAPPQ